MKKPVKKIISAFLALGLLSTAFCGCSFRRAFDTELLEAVEPVIAAPSLTPAQQQVRTKPLAFCFQKDAGLHPYYTTNLYNCAIDSLIYESLFAVDDTGAWTNVLCRDYVTSDGIHYIFTLAGNITMHDGSPMTAADVVYSLNLAAASAKYLSRLSCVTEVASTENGAVSITLSHANYNFPALLDIPIIRNETGANAVPAGTGPYTYVEGGNETYGLKAFSGYRSADDVAQSTIQLLDMDYSETKNALMDGELDILILDPTANGSYAFDYTYDFHYFSTPVLDYIGFNTQRTHVLNPNFRQAIHQLIDRETLVKESLSGQAMATNVLFSAVSQDYDEAMDVGKSYDTKQATKLLTDLGYADADKDGKLELVTKESTTEVSLLLIVDSESQSKVAAAHHVCNMLNAAGISVTMQSLSTEKFTEALTAGAFDMYYGEVRITNDNDFSCLLSAEGAANFTRFSSPEYDTAMAAYLSSRTETGREQTATVLADTVFKYCSVSPLLYRQYALITHRGTVSALTPSYSNLYNGVTAWKFNVPQEEAEEADERS